MTFEASSVGCAGGSVISDFAGARDGLRIVFFVPGAGGPTAAVVEVEAVALLFSWFDYTPKIEHQQLYTCSSAQINKKF